MARSILEHLRLLRTPKNGLLLDRKSNEAYSNWNQSDNENKSQT